MKKAFIAFLVLLLAAALILPAAAIETDSYLKSGGAYPEYGEDGFAFGDYAEEFTFPDINDKMNDGVYTYGEEYYDEDEIPFYGEGDIPFFGDDGDYFYDYGEGFSDEIFELTEREKVFLTIAVVCVLMFIPLVIIAVVIVVKNRKISKQLSEYEKRINPAVMYYDPTGKVKSYYNFGNPASSQFNGYQQQYNPPYNQPYGQPFNQPNNQPYNNQPNNQPFNQPYNRPYEQPQNNAEDNYAQNTGGAKSGESGVSGNE